MPTDYEKKRLKKVGKHYHAKQIILATWKKGKTLTFQYLENNDEWKDLDPKEAFK